MSKIIPASPLVRVNTGQALTFDPDDIESVELNMPIDVRDVTPPGGTAIVRELGKSHVHLHITFKDGKLPQWIDATEVEGG